MTPANEFTLLQNVFNPGPHEYCFYLPRILAFVGMMPVKGFTLSENVFNPGFRSIPFQNSMLDFSAQPYKEYMSTTLKTPQPAGLSVLFLTEMWERFGLYIVQGLLVLYLTQALGWSDDKSYSVSGAFTAFTYIASIVGGYVADKILGFKFSIILGGVFLIFGYGFLAYALHSHELFLYGALSVIILGTGFLKPNISSLLGTLYQKTEDTRREAGFTLFYMGINLGIVLGTLTSGYVKEAFGWSAPFMMASMGLILGVINFLMGARKFAGYGLPPLLQDHGSKFLNFLHTKKVIVLGIFALIPILIFLLQKSGISTILLSIAGIFVVVWLVRLALKQDKMAARHKLLALMFLTIISIIFWAIFFQIFFSLNLFVERNIDRTILGHQIPSIVFISLESIFIIIFAPIAARVWHKLAQTGHNPSIPFKFFMAFLFIGATFLLLSLSTHFHNTNGLVNPLWMPAAYCLITFSELLLSPIGLSAVTTLSPQKITGMMMGVWFIALGYGGKLAGVIATFSSIPKGVTDKIVESHYYGSAFLKYAILSFMAGLVVLIFIPKLKKLIHTY